MMLLALLVFVVSNAFGNAFTPPVTDLCAGAPPPMPATGTSPDGAVCLGQSVRDSRGSTWTFNAAACPNYGNIGHCLVMNNVQRTTTNKVRVQSGVVQIQNASSPAWAYWEYSIGGWLYVGSPIPTPPSGPSPPGTK